MNDEQVYPVEALEHKRAEFEEGIKRIAVERFGYSGGDALRKTLVERNRNGRYAVEWVRGAWEGFNMAQSPSESEVVCEYCGGDGYHAVPRTPGVDCEACKGTGKSGSA